MKKLTLSAFKLVMLQKELTMPEVYVTKLSSHLKESTIQMVLEAQTSLS